MSVVLALALAGLACGGGTTTPIRTTTRAPATQGPTQAGQAGATAAAATAAATSAPLSGSLDVKGVTTYVDSDKFFHVVGLVTNGTDKPVNKIQLWMKLRDREGKLLDQSFGNSNTTGGPV